MSVGRGAVVGCAALWVFSGCVAVNPRWDGVDAGRDDDGAASAPDDDGGTDDATSDDGASSGIAESSWTGGESSSSAMATADDGPPTCPRDDLLCDGVCKNVQKDKHACGADCTDCVVLFDDDKATCIEGECHEPDDDDDDGPGGDD